MMIRRPVFLTFLAIALVPQPGLAQYGRMGGGMGGQEPTVGRTVEVELDGGQKLGGKLQLDAIFIDADVGQYRVAGGRVKRIQLTGKSDPEVNEMGNTGIRGTVSTASGREITGTVHVPNWTLVVEDGTLTLPATKLRTLTFATEHGDRAPTRPDAKAPDPKAASSRPAGPDEVPPQVQTIQGPGIVALIVRGPKVTRIAASDALDGAWQVQELREPAAGTVSPFVGPGVASYRVGRFIYAYIAAAHRWGILELPEGSRVEPLIGPGSVSVQSGPHTYTLDAKSGGRWRHFDVRTILDQDGSEDVQKADLDE